MKRLSLAAVAVLVLAGLAPGALAAPSYQVTQKTLATYVGNTTSLTTTQKIQIKAAIAAAPNAEKFICTGIRYFSQPMSVNIMVRTRAKAACEYAKTIDPNLSTWYQNKPTQARSYAGKVLLTIKNAISQPDVAPDSQAEIVLDSAVQQVKARLATAKYSDAQINSFKSPNYPQELVDLTLKATQDGVAYLADEYDFTGADFIYFTEEDAEWAQAKWDEIVAGTSLTSVKVCGHSLPFPCRSAEYTYQKAGKTKYITYMYLDGNDLANVSFGAHGTIHWFQGNFQVHTMPNWLVEGSATFYGEVIGWLPNETNAKLIKWNGDYILHDALLASEQSIREKIKAVEVQNPSYSTDGYTLGRMLYTALVGLHGEQKALELMRSFGTSSDYEANFQNIYGFSKEAFYDEAIPLIAEWADRDWGIRYPAVTYK